MAAAQIAAAVLRAEGSIRISRGAIPTAASCSVNHEAEVGMPVTTEGAPKAGYQSGAVQTTGRGSPRP